MDGWIVDGIAVVSMAGIAVVAVVPGLLGAGMAGLLLLGMVDGPLGGRLEGLKARPGHVKGDPGGAAHGGRQAA